MTRTTARILLIVSCCLYTFIALPDELDVDAHPVIVVLLSLAVLGALIWAASLTRGWWGALTGALAGAIVFLVADALTEVNRVAAFLDWLGISSGPDTWTDVITFTITLAPAIIVWAVQFNRMRVAGQLPGFSAAPARSRSQVPAWGTPPASSWSSEPSATAVGRFDLGGDSYGAGQPGAAGWYADPGGTGRLRWWDGRGWTNNLR